MGNDDTATPDDAPAILGEAALRIRNNDAPIVPGPVIPDDVDLVVSGADVPMISDADAPMIVDADTSLIPDADASMIPDADAPVIQDTDALSIPDVDDPIIRRC